MTYLTKSMHVNGHLSPSGARKIEEQLKREDLPAKTRTKLEKQLKRDKLPPEAVAGIKEALKSKDLPPEARDPNWKSN